MMKFFRKYNKHLLAVFMALLLIIWLGGSALDEIMTSRNREGVVGTSITGPITEADRSQAERETSLLTAMTQVAREKGVGLNLMWQTWQWSNKADEQLGTIEWILLKREAQHFGIDVSPDEAKSRLVSAGLQESDIHYVAQRMDRRPDGFYVAAANFFSVQDMLGVYLSAAQPPESQVRQMARDIFEQASIEAITFPAASFADPDQTFTNDELTRHFEQHKSARRGGGLNFGYYIEPKVKVQYIRIDPATIKQHLRGADQTYMREAFAYWQANRETAEEFRWTLAEVEELKQQSDASTNGITTNGVTTNGVTFPTPGDFYADFAQAKEKAIAAVKQSTAQAEADRIVTRLLQALREPWFAVTVDDQTGRRPAPASVKSLDYYDDIVAALPANLRYDAGIEVQTLDMLTMQQLAEIEGFGQASLSTDNQQLLQAAQLAFDVEGLAEPPEEFRRETSLHLALWETITKPLSGPRDAFYLFRVVDNHPGHAPEGLTEVADQVADDLRLLAGMEAARQAAEAFVADIGTQGLLDGWLADEDLKAKVTPDRGGYVQPAPFARDSSFFGQGPLMVTPFGKVTPEFIDKSFELAAAGPEAGPAVVDLPDEARVAVIQGMQLRPLYKEDFRMRREFLVQRFVQDQLEDVIGQWLNARKVRERNGFEINRRG
jgi:hypothetical protein